MKLLCSTGLFLDYENEDSHDDDRGKEIDCRTTTMAYKDGKPVDMPS
jgi:hypothetical protein